MMRFSSMIAETKHDGEMTAKNPIRNMQNGRFAKQLPVWTPETWDDAFLWKNESYRVFRPDYPRGTNGGYAFRSHIVYWLRTGIVPKRDELIHHKNEIKTDDRLENLELKTFGQHTIDHCVKPPKERNCKGCGVLFQVPKRHTNRNIFCSFSCYSKFPKVLKRKSLSCKSCGKTFNCLHSRTRYFCSRKCSATHQWRFHT